MTKILDLCHFLDLSPTPYHAVDEVIKQLKIDSFQELHEVDRWNMKPGGKYFVTRHHSSICAFILPATSKPDRLRLLAAHTDSPGFKLKPNSEFKRADVVLLATEIYGSPLLNSWLNRDLGIAGRIFYKDESHQIKMKLINNESLVVTIPQLAIHLDREINEKGLLLNKQDHFHAIVGLQNDFKEDETLLSAILPSFIKTNQVLASDLLLFPIEKSRLIGKNKNLLSSYRLDNLASVHAALEAIRTQSPHEEDIKMVLFTDHEEVGSNSTNGAASSFLKDLLSKLYFHLKIDIEEALKLQQHSLCLSIDMAHALHPNYIEKHDPQHQTPFGKGIIFKNNAQNRYASLGHSLALARWIADEYEIPNQMSVSRNDIPCGTTIGPILATQTGIPTVDLGCGQLSMHSSRELMCCADQLTMLRYLEAVLAIGNWPNSRSL